MIICIPTLDDKKELSAVSDHFGSAAFFTIYDTEAETFETLSNSNQTHEHGMCSPMDTLRGKEIDSVVCRGLGLRALEKLNASGISVLRSDGCLVRDVLASIAENMLDVIESNEACHDHHCH